MKWLPDTNVWISHFRGKDISLSERIEQTDPVDIGLSTIVIAELCFGAYRGKAEFRAHNLHLIEEAKLQYREAPFDFRAADHYGQIRADLNAQGMPIGPNDLLIAATALANGLILVTHNTTEFGRVRGLSIEDWLSA